MRLRPYWIAPLHTRCIPLHRGCATVFQCLFMHLMHRCIVLHSFTRTYVRPCMSCNAMRATYSMTYARAHTPP
jgi:hypothetical protein